MVERAARGFRALGVNRGIKVALMLPNCPYTVICFYAVLKAGGTVVNINPLYASPEIAHLIDDSGSCILVTLNMKVLYRKVAPLLAEKNRLEKIVVCSIAGVGRAWMRGESQNYGPGFGTSLALITLQVPNRYLPIFQRAAD